MEFIRAFILLMGILSYSSNKTALNWLESIEGIPMHPYSPVYFVPQMFDWGQIWTVQWVNAMIGEKILTNSGYMGLGIILLEN
jgi:hypothetical protein